MKKITVCRLCSACCPLEVDLVNGEIESAKRITPFEKTVTCLKILHVKNIVYSKKQDFKASFKGEKRRCIYGSFME